MRANSKTKRVKNLGHLVQIIDLELDIAFPAAKMPKVYSVLVVQGRDYVGQRTTLSIHVSIHIDIISAIVSELMMAISYWGILIWI